MTGPLEFREMLRDHEDTKREYRELNAKCEALRTQLAESEAACAGYRAALGGLEAAVSTFFGVWNGNSSPEGQATAVTPLVVTMTAARQALQSNPGKAVGDVIAAARHSAQMHEARAEWIRETALKWNELSVVTGRNARANMLSKAADDEAETAKTLFAALANLEGSG